MRKKVIAYSIAGLLLVSGIALGGCAKKVTEVKEDTISAKSTDKKETIKPRLEETEQPVTPGSVEEEKLVVSPESIQETILETEEEVPPQGSARGKEFASADKILEKVHFEFDKSLLTEDVKRVLNVNAEWLRDNPAAEVLIEGHCDERGTEEYNLALGERRAMEVRKYLISLGVEPERLFTISYGEEKALDPGSNEEAWARNRRTQFLVTSF